MAKNTKIEWATHTFNPWIGCTEVSAACDHCYARTLAARYGWAEWGAGQPRHRTSDSNWRLPLRWNRQAEQSGQRPRVFCASLADVFDVEVPPQWRIDLMGLIAQTPSLDWLLLTKRPQVAAKFFAQLGGVYDNVWMGTTVEDQKMADLRIPILLSIPARIRFLSCEPLLGPIDLTRPVFPDSVGHRGSMIGGLPMPGIAWSRLHLIIVGGESGPGARTMRREWATALYRQCAGAGTAFFMKQLSQADNRDFKDFATFPADLRIRELPT